MVYWILRGEVDRFEWKFVRVNKCKYRPLPPSRCRVDCVFYWLQDNMAVSGIHVSLPRFSEGGELNEQCGLSEGSGRDVMDHAS
jgi:hypothetical protein